MPTILSASVQSRWKDCYAASPRVRLTLRTNGEELTQIITPQNAIVKAGFDAPTVAPVAANGGAGALTINTFMGYRYVYASSRYPFVDNAVTGGGELWPRSSPSDGSNIYSVGAVADRVTLTVTKTTRSDVDWIWVYRTPLKLSSAEAQAALDAGQMFYIGRVANDGIAGTTTYSDNNPIDTSELLELDNYVAPTMQFCVFDGTQWFGIGNFPFDYEVTLNNTSTVTLTGFSAWFSGRDGQTATFDGVTTGGYDGRGSYYFKTVTSTTASLYSDAAMTSLIVVPFNGTTKIHLKGFATTLYRSKPLNPFSWGKTDDTFGADGSDIRVPSEFAIAFGSGSASAMSLIGDDAYLILSFEEPTRMLRLALDQSDSDSFALTAKDIDTQQSFGSHFTQVLARYSGKSILTGVDSKNFDIIATGGDSADPVSDAVFRTMRTLYPDVSASRLFHAVYDAQTELTAFWVKTKDLGGNLIDTCLLLHGPTGRWSLMPDQQVSESATIYDPQTKSTFTMLGLESGQICTGFDTSYFGNILRGAEWVTGVITVAGANIQLPQVFTTPTSITNTSGTDWLITNTPVQTPPSIGSTLAFSTGSGAVTIGVVTSVSSAFNIGDNTTSATLHVTAASSLAGLTTYFEVGSDAVGLWIYVVFIDQTVPAVWMRIGASNGPTTLRQTFTPDYIYFENDTTGYSSLTDFLNGTGIDLTGETAYVGVIPCRHRRYLDLGEPTKTKALTETWSTMQNVTTHYCRVFEEFDDALVDQFRFQLSQQRKQNNNLSQAWNTKTATPATMQLSFGFEILEVGFLQWKNYNYVLKFRPAA